MIDNTVTGSYCMPTFFVAAVTTPALLILPTLYAHYTTITLAQIGLILMVTRALDAVTDPLIGFLSDRTRSRWGPRKPWVAAGAVVVTPSVWFLFNPAPEAGVGYFLTWAFLFTLGATMVTIPTSAWGVDLTLDPKERTRLFTIRGMLMHVGGIMYAVFPLALFSRYESTALSMKVMSDLAYFVVIALPISYVVMLYVVPQGSQIAARTPSLVSVWGTLKNNRLLWRYFVVTVLTGIGLGMYLGVMYLFFADHMKMGQAFPVIAITSGVSIFCIMPIWMKLILRFGKPRVWSCALIAMAPTSPIIWFVEPGMGSIVAILVLTVVGAALLAGHFAVSPVLLGDIIDYDKLRFGENKAGNIFSLSLIVNKVAYAGGAGLGLFLVGQFGYQPGADNGPLAVFGLAFCFSILPALLLTAGGVSLLRYPVSMQRQDTIKRRLDQRAARAAGRTV